MRARAIDRCFLAILLCGWSGVGTSLAADASKSPLAYVDRASASDTRSWLAAQVSKYRNYPRLDLAFRMMQSGRTEQAREELERLLVRDPQDLRANTAYLILLYNDRDYEKVLHTAEIVLKSHSAFVPALVYRGLARQALGQNDKAVEDFTTLSGLRDLARSDRIFVLDTLIDLAISAKRYDEALKSIDALAPINKDSRLLYYRKGIALQGLGRQDEAGLAFRQALNRLRDPADRTLVLETLGDLEMSRHDWKNARITYEAALQLNSNSPGLLRSFARTVYEMKDYAEASQTMTRLLALRPDTEDRLYLANIFLAQKNYVAAEEQFRAVVAGTNDPRQLIPAWRALIELSRERKDSREALRLSKSLASISAAPEDHRTLLALLEEEKDFPGMIRELDRASILYAHDAGLRYQTNMELGYVYQTMRDPVRAASAFSDAMRVKRSLESLNALSRVLEQTGNIQDSIRYKQEALDMQSDPELRAELAALYVKAGDVRKALENLDEITRKASKPEVLIEAWRQTGYLYSAEHRNVEAAAAFEQALRLNPSIPELNISMAEACLELRDFGRALPYLEHARILRNSVTVMRMLATAYSESGNLERSIASHKDLLSYYPRSSKEAAETQTSLAYLYIRSGDFAGAGHAFLSAFEDSPEHRADLLAEGARNLERARDWQGAAFAWRSYLNQPSISPASRQLAWESLAWAYVAAGNYPSSAEALRKAIELGNHSPEMRRRLAFSYYQMKEWRLSLNEFLQSLSSGQNREGLIGAGRCYQHLEKPGLAIYYFSKAAQMPVTSGDSSEQQTLLADLGYLYVSLGEYSSAAKSWEDFLKKKEDPSIRIQLVRALRLSGELAAADIAIRPLRPEELSKHDQTDYLDELGGLAAATGDADNAVRSLLAADRLAPAAWREYQLGLEVAGEKDPTASLLYFEAALKRDPANPLYMRALAYAYEKNGNDRAAGEAFRKLRDGDPANPRWYKALGYVEMRRGHNAESARWFRQELDLNGPANDSDTERDNYLTRSEIGHLADNYDFTFYHGYVSNGYMRSGAIDLLGGNPFPAPSGLEASWRPPVLGLRNGRIFQVFGRVLWNSDHVLLGFDSKYYESTIGVRYKPLSRWNLWLSTEKLLHTGIPSQGRWLLQALYSWNPGSAMNPNRDRWNYTLAFSDTASLVGGTGLFSQYSEFRRGVAFNLKNRILLIPHVVADGRWQSGPLTLGTYAEGGAGVSLRYLFNETPYTTQRSTLEFLFQCKVGNLFPRAGTMGLGNIGYGGCSATGIFRFGSL